MKSHGARNGGATVVEPKREWAVYRCAHGCLHLSLDRVMVTLTEDEFHALHDLMSRARQELVQPARQAQGLPRTH